MSNFSIITLFPELIEHAVGHGVLGRALDNGIVRIQTINPRNFSDDERGYVDDAPYGGGPGMVMQAGPLRKSLEHAHQQQKSDEVIYLSPQGNPATHADIAQLAQNTHTTFICGRYEGIDQRVIDHDVTRELSIGDFVMSGGEFAALCLLDAISRLLPGVLGNVDSARSDSFHEGLLDHPHYTRPENIDGQRVPAVLLSGDHQEIQRWRRGMALAATLAKRPDLLDGKSLDESDKALIAEFRGKI